MDGINHTHSHVDYHPPNYKRSPIFDPLRRLVDGISVKHYRFAHLVCRVIPCCCPFERSVSLFGRSFHIPPLCKLNPLYDEFVAMRFRALSYLADDCGEDVTRYIC